MTDNVKELTRPASDGQDQDRLLSAKEVRAIFSVTDKTLHVWDRVGLLPRVRIDGVVRYRREDVERALQIMAKENKPKFDFNDYSVIIFISNVVAVVTVILLKLLAKVISTIIEEMSRL
jgi:hypothetical protein